jgi:hypothetical protein
MKRSEKHMLMQFIRLCSVLTQQGFHFRKHPELKRTLIFPRHECGWLFHPNTRTPHCNGFRIRVVNKNEVAVEFVLWSCGSKLPSEIIAPRHKKFKSFFAVNSL